MEITKLYGFFNKLPLFLIYNSKTKKAIKKHTKKWVRTKLLYFGIAL